MECENCNAVFAPNPYDPSENLTGQCPNCGHPYAGHLPTPIHDEMTHGLDAMPTSTQDDMSGNPLQEGTLGYGDGGWGSRMKRDESYASTRYADEHNAFGDNGADDFSLGGQLPVEQDDYHIAVPSHTFIVTPGGQIHSLPDEQPHENIARTVGHPDEIMGSSALGRLYSNGETSWYGNGPNHSPSMLTNLLSDHFGQKVTVNPSDLGVVQASWDPLERFSADFEAEDMDVVPPGGHTVEAVPGRGLHGGIVGPLKSIRGLMINGRPLDDAYASELGSWEDSSPLMLSHDDPQLADVAKQVIETGSSGPLVQHAMDTQAAHRGEVQFPRGITNNLHQTLGNLGAWVANPMESNELRPWKNTAYRNVIQDYHDQNRPAMTSIGVRDPAMLKVIQDVAQQDNLDPLYSYHGIPRQGSRHQAFGDVGDPGFQPSDPNPASTPQGSQGGGLSSMLGPAAGSIMGRAFMGGGGAGAAGAAGAAGGAGAAAGGEAAGLAELAPLLLASVHQSLLHRSDKIEHPNSQDSVGTTDDDPEKVDQHEVNDGDFTPGQDFKQHDQDGGGGGDSPFGEDSQGLQALEGGLPIVLQFAMSDKSAKGHPLVEAIHKMLDAEVPGYLDMGNDEAADRVIEQHGKKHAAFGPGAGVPNPGSVPNPSQQFNTPLPQGGNHGKCPICGSTYDPSHPTCPQCGAGTIAMPGMQTVEKDINGMQVGAALGEHSFQYEPSLTDIPPGMRLDQYREHQGPRPNAVIGPCPNCMAATDLAQPFCKHCLQDLPQHMSKVAVTHQGPHTPEQQQAVAQVLIEQGRQDEIPTMLDPTQAWQYADELAQIQGHEPPPEGPGQDPAPPPGEEPIPQQMPVPPMQAPPLGMQAALERYAADSVAPQCPECDSHTTGMVTDDGTCRCHACGHVWKSDVEANSAPDEKTSRWQITAIDHQQDLNMNPSDAPAADAEKPFDPEMDQDPSHTWKDFNGQPILVGKQYKVHSQKYSIPDVVQIVAVKPESIEVQETGAYGLGYSREISHEESQLDGLEFEPVGDFSDSDPNQEAPEAPDLEVGPGDQTDMSRADTHEYGLHASIKQAELHGWSQPPIAQQCPICGGAANMHDPQCPLNEEIAKQRTQRGLEQAWRMPTVDHPLGPTAKVAGANFTPMEQHEFIDEQGLARNADKLDLSNTHYESSFEEDDLDSHFLW